MKMISVIIILFLSLSIIDLTESQLASQIKQQRQYLVDPYYVFNPDYMGGSRPSVQSYQNSVGNSRSSSCTCTCGEMSFGPPVTCLSSQTCVDYCLQTYPGQCTLVNTYGCCGSSCQYFQTQLLDKRFCTCNCANQQLFTSDHTCISAQGCLTKCLMKYPEICTTTTTQACCGQDCQAYSQSVAGSCACQCQGKTFYPAPKCSNADSCASTCMTTYSECTATQTQGCCGTSCSTYVPTCTCNCGPDFTTTTSIPCQSGQSCLDTCIRSYGACTSENTQACCGMNCINSFASCSCMCGTNQYATLAMSCGSSQQCVQACLNSIAQCNVINTQACCGTDCSAYVPTCRCQCGANIHYSRSTCRSAEQCADNCISQFGYVCTPSNTIGCCNGTFCTRHNRFLSVNRMSTTCFSTLVVFLSLSSVYFFTLI